jgi:hypothetical protein
MKTKSEEVFERFLALNSLSFEKIEEVNETAAFRPDYLVLLGDVRLVFEVKELTEDQNFGVVKDPLRPHIRMNSRTVGDHVRSRIQGARKQIQYGVDQGFPSILLIYNNIDPVWQDFGTDDMDFRAAMYGQLTVLIDKQSRETSELFQGRRDQLQERKNTSFGAVGRLADRGGAPTVTLFENVYAKLPVPYESLPSCFDVRRVEVSREPLSFS